MSEATSVPQGPPDVACPAGRPLVPGYLVHADDDSPCRYSREGCLAGMPYLEDEISLDLFGDVAAFHEKFNVASFCVPSFLPLGDWKHRVGFLYEELEEAERAQEFGDFEGVVDAHLDLIYVALGNLHKMGLTGEQFAACWNEVQRANMAKVAIPRPVERSPKPEGWTPPDLTKALGL